jgi:hypothetical protein
MSGPRENVFFFNNKKSHKHRGTIPVKDSTLEASPEAGEFGVVRGKRFSW